MEAVEKKRSRLLLILALTGIGFVVTFINLWFVTGPLSISYSKGMGLWEWFHSWIDFMRDGSGGAGYVLIFNLVFKSFYFLLSGLVAVGFSFVGIEEKDVKGYLKKYWLRYVGVIVLIQVILEVIFNWLVK